MSENAKISFFEPVDGKVYRYDESGKKLGFYRYGKLPKIAKVGLVCYHVSQGRSLKKVATGVGWRPTVQRFQIWRNSDPVYEKMFEKALEMREVNLLEELIEAKEEGNKDKVGVLSLTLKAFDKKIIQEVLPPPIQIVSEDWKHAYKKKWGKDIPDRESLDEGISDLQAKVEKKGLVQKKDVSFEDLRKEYEDDEELS